MALALTVSVPALRPGLHTTFLGTGGTEPYTYSIVSGGGVIGAMSGAYTAGATYGATVVRVTDDDMVTADLQVLTCSPLQLLCDIVRDQLALTADQVFLWDQKFNLPKDSRLYIAAQIIRPKSFGVTNRLNASGNSVQSVNRCDTITLDLFSRSLDAVNRMDEVTMSFSSDYARQQMEANSIGIAMLPSNQINLSEVDGAAIPYRFQLMVNLQYAQEKTSAVPYYDDFDDTEVTTEP